MTWGQRVCGGNSSAFREQLKRVQQIQANSGAFAAVVADGYVVTWGDCHLGGSISAAVSEQLKNVNAIQATNHAFAAILGDGSVVTWGDDSWRQPHGPPTAPSHQPRICSHP